MEARPERKRRDHYKRRSGIIVEDEALRDLQRLTNRKIPSRDRQTDAHHSDETQSTGPWLHSPEPGSFLSSGAPLPISAYNISRSASPHVTGRASPRPRSRAGAPQARRNDSNHASNASREPQSRPRTRTLEERVRDKSPLDVANKSRNRVGSLQSRPSQEAPVDQSSIGFPSILPSEPQEADPRLHRLRPHALPRPLSPIRNPIAAKPGTPLSSNSTDARKILQLMKTTCGRMQGILSFRTSATSNWASGYCAINVASGSLIYQTKGDVLLAKTLITDLRGCQVRTLYDAESKSTFLDVSTRRASMGIHLRPHVPETFDSWLAALLCWQPIRPKGVQNKMTKPQEANIAERRLGDRKRNSGSSQTKDAAIIKVGKLLMWDKDPRTRMSSPPHGPRRISTLKPLKSMSKNWRKVSCTLQENGHFKLYSELESTLEAVVPLSALSRCSIQRLDSSILDDEFCLAIYPHYASTASSMPAMQTIYLSMESRVLFEVWFVLLRAFTVPELYGPETTPEAGTATPKHSQSDLFRVERLLSLRIIEAKVYSAQGDHSHNPVSQSGQRPPSNRGNIFGNYYAEVQLDGEIRARTVIKQETSNPFWREDFEFADLPAVLSSSAIELKTRNPGQKDWTLARAPSDLERGNINPLSIDGDIEVSPLDLTFGRVDIRLDDVERATDTEKWWPVLNERDENVGEILMKVRVDELIVLMGRDYAQISELLHAFSNGLTSQITQMAHIELRRLSEILLNIFQVSGHASAWLMSLVEEEIDNIRKETPLSRFRYGRRIVSNHFYESSVEREMFVRDLGKNASVEANLLFRGNSLLTKALDTHMRRLGKEYLEETLSEKMRDIEESDPDCEVDPNRVKSTEDSQRNWRNLIALTENVWRSIAASAPRCPPELRIIMRRVRDCADDRYGDFLRTVAYSSVSGFLFLRFFCPAVLNPKLFGLLRDHPRPRAQRTLTLIAKTLQTLANMNTFGSKEPWMEPMNVFLTTHRQEFKDFVDEICDISSERATSAIPPSYATPITILGRLPCPSKEGFPSLPYLIDQARECANLVDVWLDARYEIESGVEWSDELRTFDELCEASREKSKQCLTRAEQAERPSGMLEPKWEELVEQMDRKARLREPSGQTSWNVNTKEGSPRTVNSSFSSLNDGYFAPNHGIHSSPATSRLAMTRTPNSPRSPDYPATDDNSSETADTPPGSSSGVWDPGVSPPPLDNLPPTPSQIDEAELDPENNSDLIGSSIYTLTSTTSKRDSAATARAAPTSSPPSKSQSQSHRREPRSAYSLRHSSERADISKSVVHNNNKSSNNNNARSTNCNKPGSRDGNAEIPTPVVQSLYQLNTAARGQQQPQPTAGGGGGGGELGNGTPRSPRERDGRGLSQGFFGGVLRKKGRERERERERLREREE